MPRAAVLIAVLAAVARTCLAQGDAEPLCAGLNKKNCAKNAGSCNWVGHYKKGSCEEGPGPTDAPTTTAHGTCGYEWNKKKCKKMKECTWTGASKYKDGGRCEVTADMTQAPTEPPTDPSCSNIRNKNKCNKATMMEEKCTWVGHKKKGDCVEVSSITDAPTPEATTAQPSTADYGTCGYASKMKCKKLKKDCYWTSGQCLTIGSTLAPVEEPTRKPTPAPPTSKPTPAPTAPTAVPATQAPTPQQEPAERDGNKYLLHSPKQPSKRMSKCSAKTAKNGNEYPAACCMIDSDGGDHFWVDVVDSECVMFNTQWEATLNCDAHDDGNQPWELCSVDKVRGSGDGLGKKGDWGNCFDKQKQAWTSTEC